MLIIFYNLKWDKIVPFIKGLIYYSLYRNYNKSNHVYLQTKLGLNLQKCKH